MAGFTAPKVSERQEQRRAQKSLLILGFLPAAKPTIAELKVRFRKLVFEAHPDSETFNASPENTIDDMRRAKDWLVSKHHYLGWDNE